MLSANLVSSLILNGPVVIYLPNIAWTGVILSGYRPTKIWDFNGIFDHLKKREKKKVEMR